MCSSNENTTKRVPREFGEFVLSQRFGSCVPLQQFSVR